MEKIVVESIESRTLKSATKEYTISKNLTSFLNEENAKALSGAVIQAYVIKDKIVSVISIELNASGIEGELVTFHGEDSIFLGNIMINGDNIELKNITVIGNLLLTDRASTRFVTKKLELKGELLVEQVKSIPIPIDPLFSIPSIPMPDLNIVLFTSSIAKLEINRSSVCLNSNYPISMLKLTNSAVQTQLNRGTKIELLMIPTETNPLSLICNFNNVYKNIGEILTPDGIAYHPNNSPVNEIDLNAQNRSTQALEAIEEAAEFYWQKTDLAHVQAETIEQYYAFMNQALSQFQIVFENNAAEAGFNIKGYFNLSENRRKELLFDWLLLWNITIDDYSEVMSSLDSQSTLVKGLSRELSNEAEQMKATTKNYERDFSLRNPVLH